MSGAARTYAVSELHVHLEGSVSLRTSIELAGRIAHPWGSLAPSELRKQFRYDSFADFLERIREMCRILNSEHALRRAARELSVFLGRHGILYAEVYTSPFIYVRWGLRFDAVLRAVVSGLEEGEARGGARCHVLLDTVRQWGPEVAMAMLEEFSRNPHRRVVGFGIGGEESVPFERFTGVFDRARSLGLGTVAHAGETGPPSDVEQAAFLLRVDRVAHGIRALEDPTLMRRLAGRAIPFDLAVTSNYRTRAWRGPHPIRDLLDQGIPVTLGTDDPSLFRTDPVREYGRARRFGALREAELWAIARNGIEYSFADEDTKGFMREQLDARVAASVHGSTEPEGGG